jgi:DNA-binding NarL/FixJ family response regulator
MIEMNGKRRILIVDDHTMFRQALAEVLGMHPDLTVVGCSGTVREAVEVLDSTSVDLVLLDYDLGRELAFDLIEIIQMKKRPVRVLILSAGITPSAAKRLYNWGVHGILWKQDSVRELVRNIRTAMAPAGTRRVEQQVEVAAPPPTVLSFTARQRQVAQGVLHGLATKEIAARLAVSDGSVKCTLQQLFGKTGTRSRAQLVRALLEKYSDRTATKEPASAVAASLPAPHAMAARAGASGSCPAN